MDTISLVISIVSAIIALAAVLITLVFSLISHKQYIDSLDPQLSFKLSNYEGFLFLSVKNTGKLPANELSIKVLEIKENGVSNELLLDRIFKMPFMLSPEETIQGMVGIFGENLERHVFPYVELDIQYNVSSKKNKVYQYTRTVTFSTSHEHKVDAEVHMDLDTINSRLVSLSRSNIRIANYMDGSHLASFDELEILADNSLKKDLSDIIKSPEKVKVSTREETVDECLGGSKTSHNKKKTNQHGAK